MDLTAVRAALDEREQHRSDIAEHVDTDMAFHRSIAVAAQSPVLRELFDSFAPRNRQAMIDMLRLRGHHGDPDDQGIHVRMYEAIATKDVDAAARLTRTHLRGSKDGLA